MKATFRYDVLIISVLLLFSFCVGHVRSEITICPEEEIDAATSPKDGSWNGLYSLFTTLNKVCDDGSYAEAISDFVAQSLAKHWDHFDELATLTSTDKQFEYFIISHISTSADCNDVDMLLSNAQERCPANDTMLCFSIIERAREVLKEVDELRKNLEKERSGSY